MDVQMSGDGVYPIFFLESTINNIGVEQQPAQEKSVSGLENEVVNKNSVINSEEEPTSKDDNKNGNEGANIIIWKNLYPNFPCEVCTYTARKRYLLLRHLKTHNINKRCDEKIGVEAGNDKEDDKKEPLDNEIKEFPKLDDDGTDNDIEESGLRKLFVCNECCYKTNRKYLFLRHGRIHSGDRPYKCKICERGFTTKSSLQAHLNMHYGVKNNICKFCKITFTTSGQLNRHVKYKHTMEKPYKCTECEYAAVERSKLLRHMRYHTGERPYQCPHCTYASQDTSQLKRHLRTHFGEKPYKCDHCDAIYATTNSLKLHKLVHNPSEARITSSDLGPDKIATKSEMRQCLKNMHASQKALKCKRCGETFSDRHSYKIHSKSNECEKYFKCQLCSFATKKFIHLNTHMTIHTGEKPSELKQSFTLNTSTFLPHFQVHNKTHEYVVTEQTYDCQKCDRKFPSEAGLNIHAAIHDKEDITEQE